MAFLFAVILVFLPPPSGMTPLMMRGAAVVVLSIGLWSTGVLPSYFGALIFMFAAMVLAVAPTRVTFSGFASGAMWLVFAGLVLGEAVQRVKLDGRLIHFLLQRFPISYLSLCYGLALVGVVLAFLLPSASGRVVLLVPVAMALATRVGFDKSSRGRTGLILAATMGTMSPAFAILPANVPNMSLLGSTESVHGLQLAYAPYLLLNFPVLGLFPLIVYPLVIHWLFREKPDLNPNDELPAVWTAKERQLLVILLLALALWLTDTLHGVAPAWVGLGAALLCLLPRIGVLPPTMLTRDINYTTMLFLAGVIGLGAVATHTGLGPAVAARILEFIALEPGTPFHTYMMLVGMSIVVGILTTLPPTPGILVPMAQSIADASGWTLMGVLMTQVPTWLLFPFPYQAPPVVMMMAMAGLRIGEVTRLLVVMMAIGLVVMLPLHYLWGRWLGVFG